MKETKLESNGLKRISRRAFHQAFIAGVGAAVLPQTAGCLDSASCRADRPLVMGSRPICETHPSVNLLSYGGVESAQVELRAPRSLADLRALLDCAKQSGRRVSFRAAGLSVGGHALGEDLMVDLRGLSGGTKPIVWHEDGAVTVHAGQCWGKIVDSAIEQGRLPKILVTGSGITAGGTLSANCLSRFSPLWGKEGTQVRSFTLVTAGGEILECSRSVNRDLFRAAIGGFGCFGGVTRITYETLALKDRRRVATRAMKHTTLDTFVRALIPDGARDKPLWDEPSDATRHGVLFLHQDEPRGVVYRSQYSDKWALNQYPVYNEDSRAKRDLVKRIGKPEAIKGLHRDGWNLTMTTHDYIDAIKPYTFFQDSHIGVRFERLDDGDRDHVTVQQSLVIPAEGPIAEDRGGAQTNLLNFLKFVTTTLKKENFPASFIDVILLPADDMLLSASCNLEGFVVSIDFERRRSELPKVRELHNRFATRCLDMGGRMHLVKSLLVEPNTMRTMYGDQLTEFIALKQKYDPDRLLRNPYLEKAFGVSI